MDARASSFDKASYPSGIDAVGFPTAHILSHNHYHSPAQPTKDHTCSCTVCKMVEVWQLR